MIIIGGVRYRPEDIARLGLVVKEADTAAAHDSAITALLSTPAGQTAVEDALADSAPPAEAAPAEPVGTQPLSAGTTPDAPPAASDTPSEEPSPAPDENPPAPTEPAPTPKEGATSGNTSVPRGRRGSRNADRSAE